MFDVQFLLAICCVTIVGFICYRRVFLEEGRGWGVLKWFCWRGRKACSIPRLGCPWLAACRVRCFCTMVFSVLCSGRLLFVGRRQNSPAVFWWSNASWAAKPEVVG